MSILKRQRELKNAEKAARKRARRHGQPLPGITEPRPTLESSLLSGMPAVEGAEPEARQEQDVEGETETAT
jgi:hypothetical protein